MGLHIQTRIVEHICCALVAFVIMMIRRLLTVPGANESSSNPPPIPVTLIESLEKFHRSLYEPCRYDVTILDYARN